MMILCVLLVALGMWFVLRSRVPVWLLVILIVVLAPVGGVILIMILVTTYASAVYNT